jgi:DUF4097 and DUF4098 domain-containing protein YvlB
MKTASPGTPACLFAYLPFELCGREQLTCPALVRHLYRKENIMLHRRNASTLTAGLVGVLSLLVLLAGCSADVHAGQSTEEFHQSWPLSAGGRVELANINGNVTIVAADTNQVKVDAIKRGSDPERLKYCRIEVSASPDVISIKTEYDRDGWFFAHNNHNASVDYTITVPRNAQLDKLSLVNGGLKVTGVTGGLHASLVNGGARANDVAGAVDVSSVNGGVDITLASPVKSARLHSVNGGVTLTAPSDLQAEVKAGTVNGGIRNDFGLTVNKGQHHTGSSMRGRLGSGATTVDLSTVNGGITLLRANDNKPLSRVEDSGQDREAQQDREPL